MLFIQEDVCGLNPLPGYENVEKLALLLVAIAMEKNAKLSISPETREAIITPWGDLTDYDKVPTQFRTAYTSQWGNTLYCRTKGDAQQAALTQKVQFNKRHTPAHQIDAKHNRLVYCIVKHLWLKAASAGTSSPSKHMVSELYQVMQQRINIDDAQLSKLAIPLPHINSKCVAAFIKRQTSLASFNSTKPTSAIKRREESVSDQILPAVDELPATRPETSRPEVQYMHVDSHAGEKTTQNQKRHNPDCPCTTLVG